MDIKIRKATLKDLNIIQDMSQRVIEHDYHECSDMTLNLEWSHSKHGKKFFTDAITEDKCCVFIAEADGNVAGYVLGEILRKIPHRKLPVTTEMANLFVEKEFRGKGVAPALF